MNPSEESDHRILIATGTPFNIGIYVEHERANALNSGRILREIQEGAEAYCYFIMNCQNDDTADIPLREQLLAPLSQNKGAYSHAFVYLNVKGFPYDYTCIPAAAMLPYEQGSLFDFLYKLHDLSRGRLKIISPETFMEIVHGIPDEYDTWRAYMPGEIKTLRRFNTQLMASLDQHMAAIDLPRLQDLLIKFPPDETIEEYDDYLKFLIASGNLITPPSNQLRLF